MSESSELDDPNLPTRSMRRYVLYGLGVVTVLILFGICAFFFSLYLKFHRHAQVSHRMEIAITRLAFHRPEHLTDDQWAYCITWTWMLHGNYGSMPTYVATEDLEQIVGEFETKIDAGPDLNTIDWLWDEYIKACPRARNYDNWRPTSPENREQFEAGAQSDNSLSYWQSEFKTLSESGK